MAATANKTSTRDRHDERNERFVTDMLQRCRHDKGLAARLRRADNPATEYQSWEFLAAHGIDLEHDRTRLPFATIAAAVARSKIEQNGTLTLGRAIAKAGEYDRTRGNDPARMRLRRLLSCADLGELARILRSTLSLIDSKVAQPLDYIRLLGQMRRFSSHSEWIKAQWAQEFYSTPTDEDTPEDAA